MSWQQTLFDWGSWIANADINHNSLNILGIIWFAALILLATKRFMAQSSTVWPRLSHLRKRYQWILIFLLATGTMYFFQILIDDLITTPINIAFGSWALVEAQFGAFTFMKLLFYKADVYLNMLLYFMFFSLMNFWRFFKFTKKSAFFLMLLLAFQIFLSAQGNFNFRGLIGQNRTLAFWVSYPEFRIISGLFVASVLRKQRAHS